MSITNGISEFSRDDNTPHSRLRKLPSYRMRPRNYLTLEEVKSLADAAEKTGRHGLRDRALIMTIFRHGLRVSEVSRLQWEQVDFDNKTLFIGLSGTSCEDSHPLVDSEVEMLRRLKEAYLGSDYVFMSELRKPLTTDSVRKIVTKAALEAGLPFPISPHTLRHSTFNYLQQRGIPLPTISQYLRIGIKTAAKAAPQYESSPQSFDAIQWDL